MREVVLTRGKIALVDEADYALVSQWKWSYHDAGYAVRRQHLPSTRAHQRYEMILMHRLILGVTKGQNVDHINGNKLDNRRGNLRLCNQSENMANARKRAGTSSRFKGVSWYKPYGKWMANFTFAKKTHFLGYFSDEISAAEAYNCAATEVAGEFAKLNEVS